MSLFFRAMPGLGKPSLIRALVFSKLTLIALLPAIIGFYVFYFPLFTKFLYKKKITSLVLFSVVVSVSTAVVCLFILYLTFGPRYVIQDGLPQAVAELFAIALLTLVHGIIALAIRGFITWYNEIKLKEELNKKNYEMELGLIKAQIQPHFLFNTINNIDVLIEKQPSKASDYLNKLSDIMRFMLYETKEEEILLSKELSYIEKYIELQRLRTNVPESIRYSVDGNSENLKVAPMLFIPLVENAFKHSEQKAPNSVIIKVEIKEKELFFHCANRPKHTKYFEKGIGNEIIQRRLMLLYPGRHKLEIISNPEIYKTNLVLYHVN
jgi:LytS/YehU family sensor histidine kinase